MPNDDDFFNQVDDALNGGDAKAEDTDSGIEKVEKFKIGDSEYSQDELEKLVGLGKIGAEAEEKYQTKIDKVWPNLQRTINEKKELEEKLKAYEAQQINKKAEQGEELSPEELKKQALAQARELGIVTKEDLTETLETYYANRRAGEQLLENTERVVAEANELGKPKVDVASLLEYMQTEGIKNPNTAYEVMFKDELKKWEKDQLNAARPSGLYTQTTSIAGGKSPSSVKITKENLEQLVEESLNKGGQGA